MLLFHAFLLFYCLALVYFFFSIYTLDFIFDVCLISKQPNIVKKYIITQLLFVFVVVDFFYLIINFWGDSMKDYLNKSAKWCSAQIEAYNQYFDSRMKQYNLKGLGAEVSFEILVSRGDVIDNDFLYYACYQECVGKLDLIGALINKVGE